MRPRGGRPAIQTPMRSDRKALPLSLNCNVCATPMTVRFASHQHAARARPAAPDTSTHGTRAQASRRRRRKKGKMGRVVDFCLEQFGFGPAAPAESRIEPRGEAFVTPSFHSSPSLAPYRQLSIDLTKPGPEIQAPEAAHQSMVLENPQLKLSGPLPLATSLGRSFRTGRAGAERRGFVPAQSRRAGPGE